MEYLTTNKTDKFTIIFIATGSSKLSLFTANQVDNNQIICCQISYIQTCLRDSYHGSVHRKMI